MIVEWIFRKEHLRILIRMCSNQNAEMLYLECVNILIEYSRDIQLECVHILIEYVHSEYVHSVQQRYCTQNVLSLCQNMFSLYVHTLLIRIRDIVLRMCAYSIIGDILVRMCTYSIRIFQRYCNQNVQIFYQNMFSTIGAVCVHIPSHILTIHLSLSRAF